MADQNTRVSMILAGEVDAVREVPWSQVADVRAKDGVDMPLEASTVIFMTLINQTNPPFDDVRVRQAAAHALDTKAIAKAITHGHAAPANTTLPSALLFHHGEFSGLGYDPSRAKALLEEAGAVGKEVVIVIPANPEREQMAVIMQAQWGAVGLKAKIEKVDGGTWWKRIPGKEYHAAPSWWYNETEDPDLAVRWAVCGACGSRSFYTNYDNARVNELVEAGARELDADKRAVIYREIQEITTTEVSQIPLY